MVTRAVLSKQIHRTKSKQIQNKIIMGRGRRGSGAGYRELRRGQNPVRAKALTRVPNQVRAPARARTSGSGSAMGLWPNAPDRSRGSSTLRSWRPLGASGADVQGKGRRRRRRAASQGRGEVGHGSRRLPTVRRAPAGRGWRRRRAGQGWRRRAWGVVAGSGGGWLAAASRGGVVRSWGGTGFFYVEAFMVGHEIFFTRLSTVGRN